MMIPRTLVLAAALMAAAAAPVAAQQPFGPALDASFGLGTGGGGDYFARGGGAADVSLALPVRHTSGGAIIVALTATGNGRMASDLECPVGRDGGCIPEYPTFGSVGVAAGVQHGLGASVSARAMAGPAYYRAVGGGDAFGLQGRLDVGRPTGLQRTAIVASVRGAMLPRFRGESLRFASFGLGLRIQ
jgi:hypothetical protein